MREEKGNSPRNARIKIDYSKKKPNVRFSYPSKHGFQGNMYVYILFFITCILLLITSFFLFVSDANNYFNQILSSDDSESNKTEYNLSNYDDYLRYADEFNITYLSFLKYNEPPRTIKQNLKETFIDHYERFAFLIALIISLVLSLIIYLPFKKYWSNVYPKFMGLIASKKIRKFTAADVRKEKKLYYCELPVFNNIVLDYKATKDFSKYLNLFEIQEHKFKYYTPKIKKKLSRKQKIERIKRELNEWIWYARFYFKQRPKKGYIEVLYK